MKTIYSYSWKCLEMEDIGPGDADVYTKKGRHTKVDISLSAPVFELRAKRLKVHVIYNVREGRHDYTHLQMNRDILIPLPNDWIEVNPIGTSEFNIEMIFYGKNHKWNPINAISVNWIQSLRAKIDGRGDDLDGNAGLSIDFAIPIEYKEVS